MAAYTHTQISSLMIVVTLVVLSMFTWTHMTAHAKPSSIDSGTNFLVTTVMALIIFILALLITLTVSFDTNYFRIKFGYGIFQKKFPIQEIASAKTVKNRWYYGLGIRVWFWPYMLIYSVAGLHAVEIIMKNKKIYRIGTDDSNALEAAIKQTPS